jgi:hypothetical protein
VTGEPGPTEGRPDPTAGPIPSEDVPRGAPPTSSRTKWRGTAKWTLGVLLALDLGVLLVTLSFANVTAEGPAKRSLRHSLAILTEVDAYLDDHFETLQQEASQSPEQTVTLPDFPVPVTFTPAEIGANDREGFRALLLTRAADRLYEDGVSLLQEDRGTEVSFFSPQGALRGGMNFLRPTPHGVLSALTIALAAAAGVLALGLMATGRGYGRLLGLGLSAFVGAAPVLALAVAVRYILRVAADGVDDYLAREFLTLGQELTWAPIRNGIIFSVGGAVFLVAGATLARWSDSRSRP